MRLALYNKRYSPGAKYFFSERQLHESVQKALMKHFLHVKETTAQQLEAIKALFFTEKGHICCVTY